MGRILSYGILAALFFSFTFAINKWLNIDNGGHWFWTASLRYLYVLIFLSLFYVTFNGFNRYKETLRAFCEFWYFWLVAGGIGFGLFYLLLCYSASYTEAGWITATTWQLTILATPLVIWLLGNNIPKKGILYLLIVFTGVILVNLNSIGSFSRANSIHFFLNSILPVLVASICYPLGNTLCKYACEGRYSKIPIDKYSISNDVFSQIIMMTLGAIPVLFINWLIFTPPLPTTNQFKFVAVVAIFTGIIATGLLYKARKIAEKDPLKLSVADSTQAFEVPFVLIFEIIVFKAKMPSIIGIIGIGFVVMGIFLLSRK